MSGRRLSSTAAMYSAGVFTSSCPFIDELSHVGTFHERAGATAVRALLDVSAR